MQKLISAMVVAAALAACAHTGSDGQVVIADGLRFALRSPASFGQQVLLVQAATLSFGTENHELLVHTEITARTVVIVGALPNGARLFSIVWDGSTLQSEGVAELLANIAPAYFVADLQLAQWPLAEVRAGFAAAGDCFSTGNCRLTESADQLQRVLARAEGAVISVTYSGIPYYQHNTQYEHHGRGYRLAIETLDVQALAVTP